HREGYLGTQGNRTLLAHTVNVSAVKLTIWQMYANNLVAWRTAQRGDRAGPWERDTAAFSRPLLTKIHANDRAPKNAQNDLRIQLDQLLGEQQLADGVYQVKIQTADDSSGKVGRRGFDPDGDESVEQTSDSALITLSDVGLTAKRSGDAVLIWALSLSKAAPRAGLKARLFSDKNQPLGEAVTDDQGLARIESVHAANGERPAIVTVESTAGTPLTWLDLRSTQWDLASVDVGGRAYLREGYEAFVYSDRGVYRPGETAHLRAIVRGLAGATPTAFPIQWQIQRPDLRNWKIITAALDADGAASLDLRFPDDLPTGKWTTSIGLPGEKSPSSVFGAAGVQVEEFMPARLKVAVTLRSSTQPVGQRLTLAAGDPVAAQVRGDYLFGRPGAGLTAALSARVEPARFAPAKWKEWTFGDAATLLQAPVVGLVGAKSEKPRGPSGQVVLDETGRGNWTIPLGELLRNKSPANATAAMQPSDRPDFSGPWKLFA